MSDYLELPFFLAFLIATNKIKRTSIQFDSTKGVRRSKKKQGEARRSKKQEERRKEKGRKEKKKRGKKKKIWRLQWQKGQR